MTNIEQAATKENYVLVSFDWGETPNQLATTAKFTNANADLDTRYGTFVSDPKVKVTLPKNSIGGFDKAEGKVVISSDLWAFAPLITAGRPFPPTRIVIRERGSNDTDDNIRTIFAGKMASATRNPNGRVGLVEVRVQGAKSELDQALGFSTNESCGWVFGDPKTCVLALGPLTETASGNGLFWSGNAATTEVTIEGLSAHPNRYWRRGFVEFEGLKIRIREWSSGTTFYLSKLPPDSWSNALVDVIPGCDKLIFTCQFWGREASFSGLGFKMQDYNPLFENPQQ